MSIEKLFGRVPEKGRISVSSEKWKNPGEHRKRENPCEYQKTVWASTGKGSNQCEYRKKEDSVRVSKNCSGEYRKWSNQCDDRVSFRSPFPSLKAFRSTVSPSENPHRRIFPAKSFSDTDHTIRCARRRSSSFVKAPEGDSHPRASHAFFSGGLNLTTGEGAWSTLATRFHLQPRLMPSSHPPSVLVPSSPARGDIPEVDRVQWRKIDAHYVAKGLYTNDIQRLYKVASSIVNVRQQDMDLSTYIGQIASLKEEFLTVMPLSTDVGDQRTQIDKFFMVLTLIGLRPDLETVRDQILGSSSVPSLDDVFARLLRISSTQTLPSDNTSDSSVLVSQTNSRGGRSGNRGRGQRPHCTYCNKLGHTRDRCYQLHGRPPRTAQVAQSSDPQPPQPPSSSTSQGISLTDSEYDDYLRYQATKSASVASVAQTGNASACLTHTFSWTLDSRFWRFRSHICLSLPYLSILSFTLSDRSTGKTIGIGRESQGLYHLTSPSTPAVCISTDVPLLIHSRLGHPSLSKFRKWSLVFHLCRRLRDKLYAKTKKCIFFEGYRCYSSKTHCYFLSADVTFFEDSPFFSTFESLPVSEVLLPLISPPDAVPSRPLQVYHPCHRVTVPPSLAEVPVNSLPIPSASSAPTLPPSTNLSIALRKVGCRWVYTVKVGPDGQVDRLKAHVVAKGYTQVYGSDYGDTFSPVAKIASVRLLISMAAMRSWPFYQLDIKNAFLHGDLAEEVYMEQPPDHSVFYHHNSSGQCIYLTKDLGKLKYFLGIEIAQSSFGVVLSQRKYALDILEETGQGEPLGDPGRYRRLVGNLNYLTITRPDISFPVSVVSQFLQSPCDSHWDAVIRILRYIKSTPSQDRRSTFGYCVFIGGNLISCKSKKQDVVAGSSAEAEYRAMTLAICELIWLKQSFSGVEIWKDEQMKLICDNQAVFHIASNPVFHERPNTLK
ncbi:Retrovirus-related Pol polyprotein from transposon RE2 [Vitis vinifera]|uniref:Retrovirus-related Pol polyprotein from transposon RE2 n=1 Tax=Vitis vinifera TaxID=29760 RepID=A0A438BMV3_VITVI|nr:Retrovirus-related Pol polyprotein from transposon RE2 [Vitis vinifera]